MASRSSKLMLAAKRIEAGKYQIGGWTIKKTDDACAQGQGCRRYFWAATHTDGRRFNADDMADVKERIAKVGK